MVRCKGNNSVVLHIDWSVDGRVLRTNSASNEIMCFDTASGKPLHSQFQNMSDTPWHTWTCHLGFPVMGVWASGADGTDLTSCHMTRDQRYVVTAEKSGKLKLFNAPCVVHRAPFKECWGHASHVKAVRFLRQDTFVMSVGGHDRSVFQWRFTKPHGSEGDEGGGGGDGGLTGVGMMTYSEGRQGGRLH